MLLTHLTPDGVRRSRHQSLELYGLPDRAGDDTTSGALAEIARLARAFTGAEAALVNLLPAGRQVTAAATDPGHPGELPEAHSICAVLLEQRPVSTIVVRDASEDPRFADNPYVDGTEAALRGYAVAPLIGHERVALGTLCVAWTTPRAVTRDEASLLDQLARAVVKVFDDARRDRHVTHFAARPVARRSVTAA